MTRQDRIPKWGFGMAPISSRMRRRYDAAVQVVSDLMNGVPTEEETVLNGLSELKGMFNRYVRKDQWDYAMVGEELGNPPLAQARRIANSLYRLRRALIAGDVDLIKVMKLELLRQNTLQYLDNYQDPGGLMDDQDDTGWIYVLSTREEPNILKVGRTERSVSQRVKEINGATGVLHPFGARYVFRVNSSVEAEKVIHEALSSYRIRDDREFFDIDPSYAVSLIRESLRIHRLSSRIRGTVVWFDTARFYGFIASNKINDVYVHGSEVDRGDVEKMVPGVEVAFVLHNNRRGPYATDVKVRGNQRLERVGE